jgi:hypothetical protein
VSLAGFPDLTGGQRYSLARLFQSACVDSHLFMFSLDAARPTQPESTSGGQRERRLGGEYGVQSLQQQSRSRIA